MLVSPAAELLKTCSERRRASRRLVTFGGGQTAPVPARPGLDEGVGHLIGTVALGPPRARDGSFRKAPQSRHAAGQPCLPSGVQEPRRAWNTGRVRVNVCLCTRPTSWCPPGDIRRGRRVKVTLQAHVLPTTLSRGALCSLLQPGMDAGGHMVATAAAGRGAGPRVGAGCPLRHRNVGRLLWLWIQPGRGLGILGAD